MPQLSYANTVFATVQDVTNRVNSPESALAVARSTADLSSRIQQKIDLSKDWMRQDLVVYFQQKVPTLIKTFLSFKRSQIDQNQSEFSRNIELMDRGSGSWNYGYLTYDGVFYAYEDYSGGLPALRITSSAPDSETFTDATNGTVVADLTNENLYINRSITSTPDWDLFLPEDAINYILNPTELKHTQVSAAILAMAQDGMLENRASQQVRTTVDYMESMIATWEHNYRSDMKRGLPLVNIDISGSGTMNDWKRNFTRNELVICG